MTKQFNPNYHSCNLYLAAWAESGPSEYLMNHINNCESCSALIHGEDTDLAINDSSAARMVRATRQQIARRSFLKTSAALLAGGVFTSLSALSFSGTGPGKKRNSAARQIEKKQRVLDQDLSNVGVAGMRDAISTTTDPKEMIRIIDWIAMRRIQPLYPELIRSAGHQDAQVRLRAIGRIRTIPLFDLKPHIILIEIQTERARTEYDRADLLSILEDVQTAK